MIGHGAAWTLSRVGGSAGGHSVGWLVDGASQGPALATQNGAWHVWTAVQSLTTRSLAQQDDSPQSAAGGPAKATKAALALGNTAVGGQSMGGFLAEIRIFSAALDPLDRAYIVSLLRTRYGL